MRTKPTTSKTLTDENPFSLSLGDLMAGLLLIFILLLSFVMLNLTEETSRIDEINKKLYKIFTEYVKNREDLYKDLKREFEKDLPKWNAILDREKLSVRFREPRVLFAQGKAEVQFAFKEILDDFFPRFIRILQKEEYENDIAEIRIEGHTSSEWSEVVSEEDAYILNMELSQDRTRSVLQYVLQIPAISTNRKWIQQHLTANGLSSSRLIYNKDRSIGRFRELERLSLSRSIDHLPNSPENPEESRRVEFRVRTNAEKQLEEIKELAKELEKNREIR